MLRAILAAIVAILDSRDPIHAPPVMRGDIHGRRVGAPEWWQLGAECAAENEDAGGYATALLRSVGLTPGRKEAQYRTKA